MANNEFYRGRRKKKNVAIIVAAILVIVFALLIVLFYSMQKYAVITKDSVDIQMDLFGQEVATEGIEDDPNEELVNVDTTVSFLSPDYSSVTATAGEDISGGVRAIFIASEDLNSAMVEECCSRLSTGNALVFEMKPETGFLMWMSNSSVALNYGINYETEETQNIQGYIDYCKTRDVYLVAQISVCRDERLAANSGSVTLKTETGADYRDDEGTWLDPYSPIVRKYVVELVNELYDMGFDEVVLSNVRHPELAENVTISYTRNMSTAASPEGAVCSFAVYMAEELADREGALSIYTYGLTSLVKTDPNNGDNAPLFMKLFDRVYYNTDRYTLSFNLEDITRSVTIGSVDDRFVPVVVNYLPDRAAEISWVLIDEEEETD